MKLKLSCADVSFSSLDYERALALIALLGFRGTDVDLLEGYEHLKPRHELKQPAKNGAALKRRLEANGLVASDIFLQIHASFVEFAINHPSGRRRKFAREQFLRAVEYAVAAGSDHITILPGVLFDRSKRPDSLARSVEELAWRVGIANSAKLRLGVEPHTGSLIDTPERALDLVRQVPGLGFTLDYSHYTRAGIADARIEPLTRFATHLHARCARRGRLQAPLKSNTIDFPRIVKALARHQFTGWVGLEFVWIDWEHCNEVDVLSETIQLKDVLTQAAAKIK